MGEQTTARTPLVFRSLGRGHYEGKVAPRYFRITPTSVGRQGRNIYAAVISQRGRALASQGGFTTISDAKAWSQHWHETHPPAGA